MLATIWGLIMFASCKARKHINSFHGPTLPVVDVEAGAAIRSREAVGVAALLALEDMGSGAGASAKTGAFLGKVEVGGGGAKLLLETGAVLDAGWEGLLANNRSGFASGCDRKSSTVDSTSVQESPSSSLYFNTRGGSTSPKLKPLDIA